MLVKKSSMVATHSQSGMSLLEFLVALIVFSVGLLGVASLATSSVKSNHTAYLHSQATFIADSLLDRMRGNTPGVWAGNYNGTFTAATAAGPACDAATPCNAASIAQRDVGAWGRMLGQFLPNGRGVVACARRSGATTPGPEEMPTRPAYDGQCTLTVSWSETSETDTATVPREFVWVVQP